MIVEVTDEDIKNGKPKKADCCPIALALRRATGKDWFVFNSPVFGVSGFVSYWVARKIIASGDTRWLHLPEHAGQFAERFDAECGLYTAVPFSFELDTEGDPS